MRPKLFENLEQFRDAEQVGFYFHLRKHETCLGIGAHVAHGRQRMMMHENQYTQMYENRMLALARQHGDDIIAGAQIDREEAGNTVRDLRKPDWKQIWKVRRAILLP